MRNLINIVESMLPKLAKDVARSRIMNLWEKYDTGNGKPIAPLSVFGFTMDETGLPKQYMLAIRHDVKKLTQLGFHVTEGDEKIRADNVSVSRLVPQHDFSIRNLLLVLDHWDSAPLPEVVALPDGRYWIMEGHHRIALQILMGASKVVAEVCYDPLVLNLDK
jgi:hypothetical protein